MKYINLVVLSFNVLALNKKGLKNLFTIISLANTVYLYKSPRILRSKLEE